MDKSKEKVSDRYDSWRPFYDLIDRFPLISRPQRNWKRKAIQYLDLSTGDKVLDVGTGTGQILPLIADDMPSGKLVGTDISEAMISHARKRVEDHPDVEISVMNDDIEDSKFPDDHFDKIIATFTFTTVPDFEKAASECARILDPEGHMIILDTGRPENKFALPLFYPMMFSAKIFGRTHIDREIKEVLSDHFQVKILEENLFGMVYTLKCEI
ncbi:MAG: methyltransferase domain-containing protein [Candidatus Thermoplasmatota archaeon]